MQKLILILAAFMGTQLFSAPALVEEPLVDQDELEVVRDLIEITKHNLVIQEKLETLLVEFKDARKQFRERNDSKEIATIVIRDAYEIQELIDENHLAHLFDSDFLSELRVIAQMVNRQNLNRPQ